MSKKQRIRIVYLGGPKDGQWRDGEGNLADRLEVRRGPDGRIASAYYQRGQCLGHVEDDPEHLVWEYVYTATTPRTAQGLDAVPIVDELREPTRFLLQRPKGVEVGETYLDDQEPEERPPVTWSDEPSLMDEILAVVLDKRADRAAIAFLQHARQQVTVGTWTLSVHASVYDFGWAWTVGGHTYRCEVSTTAAELEEAGDPMELLSPMVVEIQEGLDRVFGEQLERTFTERKEGEA